ncbi:MAG: type II secretion system protein GspJ [Phycisphaeraceae bacterium]
MRRAGRQPGFTLVELIAAMTITVLVTAATIAIIRNVTAVRGRADRQSEAEQRAAVAAEAIASALRSAVRPGEGERVTWEGTDAWLNEQPADRVRFFAVSDRVIRPGEPESDVREFEFFLAGPGEEEEGESDEPPSLYRRTDPTRNGEPDEGGVVERIATGVVAMEIRYHDGAGWQEDWPSRAGRMPQAVRVELAVLDAGEPPRLVGASRLVSWPHLPGQRELGGEGEDAGEDEERR